MTWSKKKSVKRRICRMQQKQNTGGRGAGLVQAKMGWMDATRVPNCEAWCWVADGLLVRAMIDRDPSASRLVPQFLAIPRHEG